MQSTTIEPDTETSTATAWREHAEQLADFTDAHLVNRRDVWGGYLPPRYRKSKQRADGRTYTEKTVTKPRVADRGKRTLTRDVLVRHYRGEDPGDVVGLHAVGAENTSRFLSLDIDKHEGDVTADAD